MTKYTEKQWQDEINHPLSCKKCGVINCFYLNLAPLNCLGTCLLCPKCKAVGFYAARFNPSNNQRYRMCKFCGFWQEVNGIEEYCNMFFHDNCQQLNNYFGDTYIGKILRYDWNKGNTQHTHFCGRTMSNIIDPPTRDKMHPYHRLNKEIYKRVYGKIIGNIKYNFLKYADRDG